MKLTLETAVDKIAQLPKILISGEAREIIKFNQKVQESISKAVDSFDFYFRSKSLWLRHLVLKEGLAHEAINSERQYFQPHAELSNNLLELIKGLHPRSTFLQQEAFVPEEEIIAWWLICETLKAKEAFSTSGILGESTIFGKIEFLDNNSAVVATLDESISEGIVQLYQDCSTSSEQPTTVLDFNKDPEGYIANLAAQKAIEDSSFETQYWKPYKKQRRKWDRAIYDCSYLQSGCILPDGKLFVTGHRRKLPKSVRREV